MFSSAQPLKRVLMSASVLALIAAPALADSSVSTETTRTITTAPVPQPLPPIPEQQSSTSYQSRTVTHSDNGVGRSDSVQEKQVAPDGTTRMMNKTIEQQTR